MKNLKFALLVVIILAAIPVLFYAQIKHEAPVPQEDNQKAYDANQATGNEKNYITVLTVSIAH